MNYTCPVCGFDNLEYPPQDFTICPSCGTEFGFDDVNYSIPELKARWIKDGRQWWSNDVQFPIETGLNSHTSMRIAFDSQTTEGFKEINNTERRTARLDWVEVRFPNIIIKGKSIPGKIGSMSSNNLVPVTL